MLQLVNAGHKSLADYATIATRGLMDEIRRLAEPLAGKRVAHLSATAFGGGVAEINYTLIPLMQDAGLEVEWRIIKGAEILRRHEDDPQRVAGQSAGPHRGAARDLPAVPGAERRSLRGRLRLRRRSRSAARRMVDFYPRSRAHWIWRGHIDFSTPKSRGLRCAASVDPRLRRGDFPHARVRAERGWAASVLHLAACDRPPRAEEHGSLRGGRRLHRRPVRHRRGAAAANPVSRSTRGRTRSRDRRVPPREGAVPGMQLALVGSMAHDDPEGWTSTTRPSRMRPAIPTSTSSRT